MFLHPLPRLRDISWLIMMPPAYEKLFPALVISSYLSVIVTLSGNLWRDFYPIFKDILRSEIGKMSGARSVKHECIVSPFESSVYFRVYRLHFQDIFKMNGLKLGS